MWRSEGPGYIDGALGHHVLTFVNTVTGARHKHQIALGHDSCPHCGTPHRKGNLDELDPKASAQRVLDELNASHDEIAAYAAKHNVVIKKR